MKLLSPQKKQQATKKQKQKQKQIITQKLYVFSNIVFFKCHSKTPAFPKNRLIFFLPIF